MIVAIDGPAGSGKSTVAHAVAERRNLTFLDTGAMYRSVTLRCLRDGVDTSDAEAVSAVAAQTEIAFGNGGSGQTVLLDGQDVTADIRTPEVDRNVSAVAAVGAVRSAMVALQRQMAGNGDVVAEGRDIGTVVFPAAEVKVFLTANAEARAHRRAVQREGGDAAADASAKANEAEERQILEDIKRRDELDSTRKESPLRPANDARVIDSSDLTLEEVVDSVLALIDEAREADAGRSADVAGATAANASEEIDAPHGSGQGSEQRHEHDGEQGSGKAKAAEETSTGEGSKPAEASFSAAADKPRKKTRSGAPKGKLHAFRGNTFDDYYDHDMRDYPLPARIFIGLIICIAGFFTKILWPWRFEQGELLWNEKRGRVIVMNHVSMLEPVAIVCSLWFHGQRCRPIYKSDFDKMGIATWLFSRAGGIPIQRGTADLKAVRRAQWALQRGENILIYPEGTRIKSDDQPVEIHAGFALIAQMAKAPVQPTAVVGARDITRPGKILKRLGRVYLKAGECLEFADLGVKGRKQQAQTMEKVAMERVYELRDELRRDHPGKM